MITKTTTYSGTVEGLLMLKSLLVEKETEEVLEGNTRQTAETGGLVVTAIFDVDGTDRQVQASVTPAQVGQLTMQQVLDAAAAKLRTALGV